MVIIGIKLGIQLSICQVHPKEYKNLCKILTLRIHESMQAQITLQDIKQ